MAFMSLFGQFSLHPILNCKDKQLKMWNGNKYESAVKDISVMKPIDSIHKWWLSNYFFCSYDNQPHQPRQHEQRSEESLLYGEASEDD